MTVEWGDPPAPRDPGYAVDWPSVVAALAERPGKWARVTTLSTARKAHDLVRSIKDGRYAAVPADRVEVVARSFGGGKGGVWMRWTDPADGGGDA